MSSLILRVGSLEFTPTSWSFEESVWKYCPELRFTLRSALPSDVFTFGDSDVSWVVISCVGSGDDKYDYVCYPKSFWDQCNVVSDCVNGDYTLPELCSVLGLPFYNGHSGSSFSRLRWVLPRLRGIKLLDALTLGAPASVVVVVLCITTLLGVIFLTICYCGVLVILVAVDLAF